MEETGKRWGGSWLPAAAVLWALTGCGAEPITDVGPPSTAAVRMRAVTPLDQEGPQGEAANHPPAVRVEDESGRPVEGVRVTFTSSAGSTVIPAEATTGADGVARADSWLLPPGPGWVQAASEGLDAVEFQGRGAPRGFDLSVRWLSEPGADARAAVAAAEALLERIVWKDLPDESVSEVGVCGRREAVLDEVVDDVVVFAVVEPIDGPGGAGAQGFPCLVRDPGTQTIAGFVRFDEAEFAILDAGLRRGFALHEMVHALGFVPGIINVETPGGFTRNCLALPSRGAPDPLVQDSHFPCPHAREAFERIGGRGYRGATVPLENGATVALTANTLNHHWRKTVLGDELMTGWFTLGVPAPLSLVTVGALEDLDYAVSYADAEPFSLSAPVGPAAASFAALDGGGVALVEFGPVPAPVVHARFTPPRLAPLRSPRPGADGRSRGPPGGAGPLR